MESRAGFLLPLYGTQMVGRLKELSLPPLALEIELEMLGFPKNHPELFLRGAQDLDPL